MSCLTDESRMRAYLPLCGAVLRVTEQDTNDFWLLVETRLLSGRLKLSGCRQ